MQNIILTGIWDYGCAFDYYSVSSEYLGEDPFGNKIFDTKYTPVGELLYRMKYNGREDTSSKILRLCTPLLDELTTEKRIDIIIPIPPTTTRDVQPVFLLAEAMASHYGIPYSSEVLRKSSLMPSKNMPKKNKSIYGTIEMLKTAKRECNILLIDDLYTTGATASECTRVLKDDELVRDVYLFSVVKTRT